jgi:RND family efflux transporter MFP subunit
MRKRLLPVILLVLVAGTATGFYLVRKGDGRATRDGVRVVHAELLIMNNTVNATGTVRLRVGSEVRVGSQLSGSVKKLNVTVGSHVRAGKVIAEIDDATVLARLAQAEAQVELDSASLERAAVDADRARKLLAQQLIPAQQGQDAQLTLAEAQARYEKSQRDRDLVRVDLDYVQIRAPISGTVASVSTQEGETVAASFTAPTFVTIIGDDSLER